MNQPQNPTPPRGARPQLFSAPEDKKAQAHARGHADFGPSILATIDGGQSRIANSRDRSNLKPVLLMSVLALVVAAVYVSFKFSNARASVAPPKPEMVAVAPAAAPTAAKPAEPPAPVASQAEAPGAAAIETVPTTAEPASSSASTPAQPVNVADSVTNIEQALSRSEPAPAKKEKPVSKGEPPVRAVASTTQPAKPKAKAAPQRDTDADLLAAMLPHIARGAGSSPALERRCGQLSGDAAADCKLKFCNGREGVDAACPAPAPGR